MKKDTAKTETPCVIYTRVSTKDQQQEGFSLDAQLGLLREYAAKCGMVVVAEYVDAESARKTGRRQFSKMIEDVGVSGAAIVVEKTDRFSRNLEDADLIERLGLTTHFVKEGRILNPSSRSQDRFVHNIMSSLAKFFSDNLREEVKKGMAEKARQGIFPSCAPVGYLNVSALSKKTIVPDPERAPIIRQLFESYAKGGLSVKGATVLARQMGLRTRRGACFARASIARILSNPLYCGLVIWDGETYAGIHEPIISHAMFEQVQNVMQGRTTRAGSSAQDFAFKGILTCGYCGCNVTAEIKKGRYIYYHCTGARDPQCPGKKSVREEDLSGQFAAMLEKLVLKPDEFEWLKEGLRRSLQDEREAQETMLATFQKEEARLRKSLERLYLDRIAGEVPDVIYADLKARFEREQAEASIKIEALKATEGKYYELGERILELAQTAHVRFKVADPATKGEIVRTVVSNCLLRDGKVQVSLHEPFDTMIQTNGETAENEKWYTRLVAIRTFCLRSAA